MQQSPTRRDNAIAVATPPKAENGYPALSVLIEDKRDSVYCFIRKREKQRFPDDYLRPEIATGERAAGNREEKNGVLPLISENDGKCVEEHARTARTRHCSLTKDYSSASIRPLIQLSSWQK